MVLYINKSTKHQPILNQRLIRSSWPAKIISTQKKWGDGAHPLYLIRGRDWTTRIAKNLLLILLVFASLICCWFLMWSSYYDDDNDGGGGGDGDEYLFSRLHGCTSKGAWWHSGEGCRGELFAPSPALSSACWCHCSASCSSSLSLWLPPKMTL